MSRHRALAVAASLAIAGAACAPPAPPEAARRQVRLVLSADPTSLSLIGNQDNNSSLVARLVSDGLVDYDATLRFRPKLAESWEATDGGRTVVFHLRGGVRWHDGRPVVASDVAFTFRKLREPATQGRGLLAQMENVESVVATDDRTVVVRYREPYADFLDAWRMPIIPEHLAGRERDLLASAYARSPVGCGPFRFVRFDAGRELVLAANDDYWGGPPAVGGLRFKILRDERTAYQALLRGEIDLLGVSADLWAESLRAEGAARLARDSYYRLATWTIAWNADGSNPFFSDPRVRRAMVLAVDRARFASTVLHDMGRPAVGTWLPESGWSDPGLGPVPFDPESAASLLDEAGWKLVPGRFPRERGGVPFRFTLLYPAGTQELADRIAAWLQQSLAGVGVGLEIEKAEWRATLERRREHRFQATMWSLVFTPNPDQTELYHTAQRAAGMNYGGFSDATVDALLERGRRTFDVEGRTAIYHELQRRIRDLEPLTCLFQFEQGVLRDRRLEGTDASPLGVLGYDPGPRAWRWNDGSGGG